MGVNRHLGAWRATLLAGAMLVVGTAGAASAQTVGSPAPSPGDAAQSSGAVTGGVAPTAPAAPTPNEANQIGDILVTAQKRGVAEAAQNVPIAIAAFSERSLQAQNVRDLTSLSSTVPNVSLNTSTMPGLAQFEARGLGVNSSTPSVEPTVGVFFNGVYMGQNIGIALDMFDIESIEVLKGPQGTLFGRNTTGGAVSIRTKRPGKDFRVDGLVSVETGPFYSVGAAVEGKLNESGTLRARVAGYVSDDQGWFYNHFDDRKIGKQTMAWIRPTIVWEPTSTFDTTLIYERGSGDGDGAPTHNFKYPGFFIDVDYRGLFDLNYQSATSESNLQVGFGNGVITNVAGYRELEQEAGEDIDGSPQDLYRIRHYLKQHQFSEELRYAGTFGPLELTVGGYYFQQWFKYLEERTLMQVPGTFGGTIDNKNAAVFGNGQVNITDQIALIVGGRYSWERKTAQVANYVPGPGTRCDYLAKTCVYNFPGPAFAQPGSKTWSVFTPKLGAQWKPAERLLLYATYSEGTRSGGYNLRNTNPAIGPGPYDQERQIAYEIGVKSDLFDRRVRLNVAAFSNLVKKLQREILSPSVQYGTVQVIQNVGNARIKGIEADLTVVPASGLVLNASIGYLHARYVKLGIDPFTGKSFDLNGNGNLADDINLRLTRAAPWSYNVNASYTRSLTTDLELSGRVQFSYRDRTAFTDANTGFLNEVNRLDANLTATIKPRQIDISIYGKNLLNRLFDNTHGSLPAAFGGGGLQGLQKGRVIGGSLRFRL